MSDSFEKWWDENTRSGFWKGSCEEAPFYTDALKIWEAAQHEITSNLDLTLLNEARRLQDEEYEYPGACGAYEEFLKQIIK